MNKVPDRKKLRRAYLFKKAKVYLDPVVFVGFIGILAYIAFFVRHGHHPERPRSTLFVIMICAILLHMLLRGLQNAQLRMAEVTYIPPVTPNTLPSEEVLVRGSEEPPVAQSEVLLRAAKEAETPQEELLRVSQD